MNIFDGFLKNKKESILQILLIIGCLILLNYIVSGIILRFDMTDNHQYTLSKPSKQIAEKIKDPITVTAYFSSHLPQRLAMVQDQFKNLLDEFRSYSHGNVEYKFVNPNKNNQSERKAQQAGVRPVMVDVRKRDQVSQKRAYLGAVFQYDGKKQVIPVIRPGNSMEYTIASTVKMLTIKKKPKIGLLQGDGEPSQQSMPQLMKELNQEYSVVNVPSSELDTTQVPANIEVLMVIGPSKKLDPKVLQSIDQYIMAGGKAIFAVNRVNGYIQRGVAVPNDTGVDKLLASYDIPVNVDLVRDVSSTSIGVRQQQGGYQFVNQVRYPYIPIITNFADNPITKGLESVVFKFVSSIDVSKADSLQKITVLA
ncbi:MAG TPA: GldG family protein, partial [Balneolales bacterium]|nr:GldG family protein [Balneolales bacterium]